MIFLLSEWGACRWWVVRLCELKGVSGIEFRGGGGEDGGVLLCTSAASTRLTAMEGKVLHHPANAVVRQHHQVDSGVAQPLCLTPVLANGSSGQGTRSSGAYRSPSFFWCYIFIDRLSISAISIIHTIVKTKLPFHHSTAQHSATAVATTTSNHETLAPPPPPPPPHPPLRLRLGISRSHDSSLPRRAPRRSPNSGIHARYPIQPFITRLPRFHRYLGGLVSVYQGWAVLGASALYRC